MNKYLQAATKQYQEGEYLIHPISEADGKIITEIIEYLKKLNRKDAVEILNQYKFKKDEEIEELLLELNTKTNPSNGNPLAKMVEEAMEKVAEIKQIDRYIRVNDELIDFAQVIDYRLFQTEDKYLIMFNPTPEKTKNITQYANRVLEFDMEENRDKLVEILDILFEKHRGLII